MVQHASLHKILCHSKNIIMTLPLSPGFFGEEVAESCNKYYRQNRRYHSGKCSRKSNFLDVFNRALDSSDPIVSSAKLDVSMKRIKHQVSQAVKISYYLKVMNKKLIGTLQLRN